jgi:glycosyltransferase involved in cell wall biosynthesis
MPTIVIVTDYYLPGYRGGGPVRTIANLIDRLGDAFTFRVITGDRDFKADAPYPDVTIGDWQAVRGAQVRYLSPAERGTFHLGEVLAEADPDLIYVNSFFSPMCVKGMWARYLRRTPPVPFVLAPRDELAPARLRLKRTKKLAYLALVKALGVYRGVLWQATNPAERDVIRAHFPKARILSAGNIAAAPPAEIEPTREKGSPLRVIFLSRISTSKNLSDALNALKQVTTPVTFDIYGPREDPVYWKRCERLIAELPSHVEARYRGEVQPEDVIPTFNEYDAFLFPTLAENYGHVIWEALYAGCLPVISDRTPWQDIPGWVHPLGDLSRFAESLDALAAMPQSVYAARCQQAHALAVDRAHDPEVVEATRRMFHDALEAGES